MKVYRNKEYNGSLIYRWFERVLAFPDEVLHSFSDFWSNFPGIKSLNFFLYSSFGQETTKQEAFINIIKVTLMNILHKERSWRTNQIMAYVPLHADPGGIKDSHQPEHPLQDIPDGVWWGPEGADFWQWLRFDVTHSRLCCLHQRLYLGELSVDGLLPGL